MEQLKYISSSAVCIQRCCGCNNQTLSIGSAYQSPDPMRVRSNLIRSNTGDLGVGREALAFGAKLEDFSTLLLDFWACRGKYDGIIQYCGSERFISHGTKCFNCKVDICIRCIRCLLHNNWNLFHSQIRRKASLAMHLHVFVFQVNEFAFEACILDLLIMELALAYPVRTHKHFLSTVSLFVDVLKKHRIESSTCADT